MTPAPTTSSFAGGWRTRNAPVDEDDRLLVDLDAGQLRDVGTGRNDDVLGLQHRFLSLRRL